MRNQFQGQQEERRGHPPQRGAGRRETLRRGTLATNCRIFFAAVAASMPFTLWFLASGIYLPFVVAIGVLGLAFASFTMVQRGNLVSALNLQVVGLVVIGAVMTVADPALADFGLATALLAPILASVLGYKPTERLAWTLAVAVVACGALAGSGVAEILGTTSDLISWTAGIVYSVAAIVVGYTAHSVGQNIEGFERAQLDTFRHLVEHLQNAVLRFSADGDLLFISQSAGELFGCPRYELAGSGLIDRIHVQDRPTYLTALADANRNGVSRIVELRMRRDEERAQSHGVPQFVWVELSFSPVIGVQNEGRYEVIALLRDVSRRKAQEDEMLKARRAAEEASHAKSHFLATIGHELRTPLNAIVGFSEMMSSEIVGKLDGGQREYVELIHKSGMHLLDIVNMLLDMSKIEAGKFELQLDSFAPNDLVQPCVQIVEPLAAERKIRITSHLAQGLPKVVGDERAYRQILINLLSNAIKFSPDGGEVKVAMRRQGQSIAISVADTGIGMSKDTIQHIGEPFFQAQRGFARKYEGTGLGLSIVKGLLELHQGKLHVASEPGGGTEMTVITPISGPRELETPAIVTPLPTKPVKTSEMPWQNRKSAVQ